MTTNRAVHEGRVHCPQRGEVDVERCLSCIDLEDVIAGKAEGDETAIVCRPGGVAQRRDERFVLRW